MSQPGGQSRTPTPAGRDAGPIVPRAGERPSLDPAEVHARAAALASRDPLLASGWRPLLEYIRGLLDARAVGLLPPRVGGEEIGGGRSACVVTTRGITASDVAGAAGEGDAGGRASARAIPALGPGGVAISVPLAGAGEAPWSLVALLALKEPDDARFYLVLLQALAGYLHCRDRSWENARLERVLERLSDLLATLRRCAEADDHPRALRVAVDDLRGQFGCERVVYGRIHRGRARVAAISGVGKIDPKGVGHQPYEEALREVVAAGARLDVRAGEMAPARAVALEILQRRVSASRVVALPLRTRPGERPLALLLEWGEGPGPTEETMRLIDACAPYLPALFDLLERSRPGPVASLRRLFWGGERRGRAIALGSVACVLLALAFLPVPYPVRAPCRLAPAVKRVVAAPFTGELREALVRPGDSVGEGQLVARMENRELKLKEAELVASRDRALKLRDRALTDRGEGADYAQSQVAALEASGVEQDLALVRRRISMLDVPAPIGGVIVTGDLERARGVPVQQGQVLFEIAPLEGMLVEIDVPDRDVGRVREGLRVSFRLDAFGGRRWESRVNRLYPHSEQRDSANVFVCEAPVPEEGGGRALRPGMRGGATISCDRVPGIWILTHRLWEFIVTTLFW